MRKSGESPKKTTRAAVVADARVRDFKRYMDQLATLNSMVDLDGTLLFVSAAAADLAGVNPDELVGKKYWEAPWWSYSREVQARLMEAVEQAASGQTVRYETMIAVVDGTYMVLDFSIKPAFDENGKVEYLVGEGHDITDRKRAEEALRASEAKFRDIFEGAPIGIFQSAVDGRLITANPAMARMFGYDSPKEMVAALTDIAKAAYVYPEQRREVMDAIAQSDDFVRFEREFKRKDGSHFIGNLFIRAVQFNRKLQYLEGFIEDITERKKDEEAVRESKQLLQIAFDTVPARIFWKSADLVYVGCSRQFAIDAGVGSPDKIVGKTDFDLPWGQTYAESFRAVDRAVIESGKPKLNYEEAQKTAAGRTITIITSKVPLKDAQGHIIGVLGVYEDITRRKQAEDALRQSEEKYRELVQSANSIIIRWDTKGRIRFFNEYAQSFFGYTEEEVLGKSVIGIIVPETDKSGQNLVALMEDICAHPQKHEANVNENMRKNGERVWIAWTNKPITDETGRRAEILSVGLDVTERKRAEYELKKSEARFRAVYEGAEIGIVTLDRKGRIVGANPALQEMLGYTEKELKQKYMVDFTYPEDIEQGAQSAAQLMAGKLSHYEVEKRYVRKDGRILWGQLAASLIGGTEEEPRLVWAIGMLQDVTERKLAEQRLIDEKRLTESIINSLPGIFYMIDRDYNMTWQNKQYEELMDYELNPMGYVDPISPVAEEDKELARQSVLKVFSEGQMTVELRLRYKDGNIRHYYCTGICAVIREMPIMIGTGIDITERKQIEDEKKTFYRETIKNVTQGKLNLVGQDDVEKYLSSSQIHVEIRTSRDTAIARQQVEEYLSSKGLSGDQLALYLTGLGEAMNNAIKHAGEGEVFAGTAGECTWTAVSDKGPGIETLTLPGATLRRGFSTKISMGMGYSIMLEVSDRVLLSTGHEGTTVVLLKCAEEPIPSLSLEDLPDTWGEISSI